MKNFNLLSMITLLMIAYGGNDEDAIKFDSFEVDKVAVLSNDDPSPRCQVHLHMNQATKACGHRGELINATVMRRLLDLEDSSMKLAAETFADKYTQSYITNMLPLYNQDRSDTLKRQWYEYHYIIDTNTQKGSKNSVVYLATIDYYEGGAHGINQLLTMNFDTRTGRLLTMKDIFASGYEQPLQEMLLQALMEKTGLNSLTALHEKGYLYSMDIFPAENFILGDETITFVYNPYEIAPYALGSTELTLPYSQLSKILNYSFEY